MRTLRLLTLLLGIPLLSATVSAADLTGDWALFLERSFVGSPAAAEITLKQDGETLSGTLGGAIAVTGQVVGQKVTFQLNATTPKGQTVTVDYVGTLDQQERVVKGTWQVRNPTPDLSFTDGPFQLTKGKLEP